MQEATPRLLRKEWQPLPLALRSRLAAVQEDCSMVLSFARLFPGSDPRLSNRSILALPRRDLNLNLGLEMEMEIGIEEAQVSGAGLGRDS